MRSLLKLVVLLFCVQRGEGHWMRSLLGKDGWGSRLTTFDIGDGTG